MLETIDLIWCLLKQFIETMLDQPPFAILIHSLAYPR